MRVDLEFFENFRCNQTANLAHFSPGVNRYLLGYLIAAGLTPLFGADPPWQKGVIVFREVVPQQSAPPGAANVHWTIPALPDAADVQAPDADAAAQIKMWLMNNGKLHEWLLDQRTDWSLPEVMARDLDLKFQITRGGSQFLNPPKPVDQPARNVGFPIRFRARPPSPNIAGLQIQVATKASADSKVKKIELALGDLAPHVAGFGTAAADQVVTEQDTTAVRSALRGVAEKAWEISRAHGIVIGANPDDERFMNGKIAAVEEIASLFSISGRGFENLNWPPPDTANYKRNDAGGWVLEIGGLQIARDAKIEVPLVEVQASKTDTPQQIASREQRAEKLKKDTETEATNRLRPILDSIRNTVPTNPALRAVRGAVEADPSLLPPATANSVGQTIVFVAMDSRPRFGFKTTVEGGWSAEDRLVGAGTFNGDNLLLLSDPRKNRVDSETMSFSGGPRIQQFSGSWQLLSSNDLGGQAALARTLSVGGQIRYDSNQLLGNPLATRFSLDSRRFGPDYTIEYSSPLRTGNQEAKVFVFAWKSVIGSYLGFGNVSRQEGFAQAKGVVTSGKFPSFSLSEEFQLTMRLRPPDRKGIGQIQTRFTFTGEYSPDWLEYHFRRAEAVAEAEATFGFSQSRDYLVRYRLGMAAASASAPLFELPRLGGPDGVRGIEQGEQLGRKLGYTQITGGPSIEYIVTWFGKPRPSNASLGPIKLADVYVTGFADRGAVYERTGLAGLLWPTAAMGYGAAVELRNLALGPKRARLSLGYGYSPDSNRHRHGIPVTALAIDLN
jgi:hypothetical protein